MAGRIITLQRQARELGRLRSGYTDTSGPKARPVKSSTWIVTSHSEDYVRAAAELWGGTVEKWQPLGSGAEQWRVITDAVAIDAIMPPGDPLSQAYELWNRGGCARRCDGVTETLSDSPCVCRKEFGDDFHLMAKDKRCSETTRLSLILPAMPDIGVFRVETHGHYAANEIAATVDVIRGATGGDVMVPVRARIEPRTRVAEGKTKQFPVIVIELRGATAGQILSGQRQFEGIGGTAPRQAIEGAKSDGPMDRQAYLDSAEGCPTMDDLTALLGEAKAAGFDDPELMAHFLAQRQRLEGGGLLEREVGKSEDPDLLWSMIVAAAPEDWTTDRLRETFESDTGVAPKDANPTELRTFLQMLQQVPA
jgi:hypothetical protein